MKRTLPYLLCLMFLGLTTLFSFGGYLPTSNTIELPIEVIGQNQHTESVTVSVSDPSNVDRIWFKGYSVSHPRHFIESYPDRYSDPKAEVRLNGGPWIGITNDNVTCNEPEETDFNCVEGPYHTTRFYIPTSKIGPPTEGQNTLEFRFNYAAEDLSSGYYILGTAFLRSGQSLPAYTNWKNKGAIDGTTWQYDNPATWSPPSGYDNSTAIQDGKDLWTQRNLLTDYPGGPQITASCADCHAAKGQDLEYFSFSNKSIVSRAEFHGLSETKGKKIAAYIRSQSHPRVSWPWQPPYQPGPEIKSHNTDCNGLHPDKAPQKCWAAGAGLEWVLEQDVQTAKYLFPNGSSGQAAQKVASTQSTLNLRDLPIGLMYPDWNEWLPRTHPLDSDAFGAEFKSSDLWATYENGDLHAAKDDPQQLHNAISNWYESRYIFGGEVINDKEDPADEKMGYRQWAAVKLWEVMRGVEDYAPDVYKHGEVRSWLGPDATIFDVAPHIHKGNIYGKDRTLYDTYLDTAWYDLAMLLNAGNRGGEHVLFPIDWRYHLGHIKSFSRYGRPEPVRFARTYLKQNQVLDVGDAPASESDQGLVDWFWRYTSPIWMFDAVGAETDKTPMAYASEPLRTNLYETLFRAFMTRIMRVPKEDWRRGYGEAELEPEDHVIDPNQDLIGVTDYAEHFYRGIQWLQDEGVRASLLDSAATWSAEMWPKGNDPSVMGDYPTWDEINPCIGSDTPDTCSGSSFSIAMDSPSDGASYTAPASIPLSASVTSDSIDSVTFFKGETKIATVNRSPFDTTWTDVPSGTYTLTAEATHDSGKTKTSSPVDVSVSPENGSSNGAKYSYYEGSWTQLPDFGTLTPVTTDTSTSFTLSVRERDNQFGLRFVSYVEISSSNTGSYTFYTTSDDGSRLLVDDVEVVNNDGRHAAEEQSGTIDLSAGWHKITVEYFEADSEQTLSVSWKGPGFAKREIPSTRLYLSPRVSQSISLQSGWNVISSDVAPDTSALETVFDDVSVSVVKNESGDTYVPADNRNEIGSWASTEAYQVYTESGQTLTLKGSSVPDTTTIPLQRGWNLIPYLPDNAQAVETALQSISNELVILKDEAGNTYIPAYGIDEIGQLEPGEGYQVYVNAAVDLTYSSSAKRTTTHAAFSSND